MRNLFSLLGCLVVAFLGFGYYLGWYQITPRAASSPGHHRLEIDLNAQKIGDDVKRGVEVGTEKIEDAFKKDKNAAPAKTAPTPPAPTWHED